MSNLPKVATCLWFDDGIAALEAAYRREPS